MIRPSERDEIGFRNIKTHFKRNFSLKFWEQPSQVRGVESAKDVEGEGILFVKHLSVMKGRVPKGKILGLLGSDAGR